MTARPPLTTRERTVLEILRKFYSATGEAASMRYLSRRLHLHHKTIQQHMAALRDKGWLRPPYLG